MPAVTGMGVAKVACCQPLADSLVKLTCPSRVPVLVHSEPTWVPEVSTGL